MFKERRKRKKAEKTRDTDGRGADKHPLRPGETKEQRAARLLRERRHRKKQAKLAANTLDRTEEEDYEPPVLGKKRKRRPTVSAGRKRRADQQL